MKRGARVAISLACAGALGIGGWAAIRANQDDPTLTAEQMEAMRYLLDPVQMESHATLEPRQSTQICRYGSRVVAVMGDCPTDVPAWAGMVAPVLPSAPTSAPLPSNPAKPKPRPSKTVDVFTPEPEQSNNCTAGYEPCLPDYGADYDCKGGSGNGPYYTGPVRVFGPDIYDLDRDHDTYGCE